MNTRDLQYFIALADHGHFGKAADACFVSQPALSMQIKKLEESLGVKLLERTSKAIMLTEVGAIIADRARQILHQLDELREIAKEAKDPFSGELKIGIFPTLAPYLMPHIIQPLAKIFPKLSFYLLEEKTSILIEQLKQGKIHAAILALPIDENSLQSSVLFKEEFEVMVAHSHPLAKRKMLRHDELERKEILLLEEGHCMRQQVLSFCQHINSHEAKHFRASSLETMRYMVAAGAGITFVPKLSSINCEIGAFISLADPKPERTIGLVWRSSTTKSILLKEIEINIKKIMAQKKEVSVTD